MMMMMNTRHRFKTAITYYVVPFIHDAGQDDGVVQAKAGSIVL